MLRGTRGEYRRSIFAAATFVFLPGFAGAGGAAGDLARLGRLGLGLFCRMIFLNRAQRPPYGLGALRYRAQRPPYGLCALRYRKSRVEAFGLEASEFFERAVERALGGGASAIDRGLEAVERFVVEILRGSNFEIGAAAETPGGMDDFACEGLFEGRTGREFNNVARFELIKDVLLFRADEVGDGKETEFGCILRDAGAAFGRDRAGGLFGILPIGQDLSGGSHGRATIAWRSKGQWRSS